jgi:hypothetical protein
VTLVVVVVGCVGMGSLLPSVCVRSSRIQRVVPRAALPTLVSRKRVACLGGHPVVVSYLGWCFVSKPSLASGVRVGVYSCSFCLLEVRLL